MNGAIKFHTRVTDDVSQGSLNDMHQLDGKVVFSDKTNNTESPPSRKCSLLLQSYTDPLINSNVYRAVIRYQRVGLSQHILLD